MTEQNRDQPNSPESQQRPEGSSSTSELDQIEPVASNQELRDHLAVRAGEDPGDMMDAAARSWLDDRLNHTQELGREVGDGYGLETGPLAPPTPEELSEPVDLAIQRLMEGINDPAKARDVIYDGKEPGMGGPLSLSEIHD